jgi:hypothetical protein
MPTVEYLNPTPVLPFNTILGWTNSNLTPLLNSELITDYSLQYLPEPWWGNSNVHVLNSVVINYNPGGGSGIQHFRHSASLFGCLDYQTFADNEATNNTNLFRDTNKWHKSKRAIRIFNSLSRVGILLHGNNHLKNHLSIELIPWHTPNSLTILPYIMANLEVIFENCISFAANESMRIANTKLKNKVILRLNGTITTQLLNNFTSHGICSYTTITPIGYTPSTKGGYYKFKINSLPYIEFISIWGKIGNDFPPDVDMDWILLNIV